MKVTKKPVYTVLSKRMLYARVTVTASEGRELKVDPDHCSPTEIVIYELKKEE